MKKILLFASAIAGLFLAGSCQRESLEPVQQGNTVTYTVQVADAVGTKALGDDVNAVNELVYEVWRTQGTEITAFDAERDNLLYHRTTTDVNDGVATLELEFVNDQNFIVLFWAQTEDNGVYDATKLTEVKIASPDVANNPNAQAFVGRDFVRDCVSDKGGKVTLTRPVAQLNIGTTYASLDAFNPGDDADVTITGSSVEVTGLATSYNIATLSAGAASTVAYEYKYDDSCNLPTEPLNVNGTDYKYVAMNYVGFPANDGSNVTVTYVINTSEGNIDNADAPIENVPVKANYRTNIIGNLITSKTDYTVTLDKTWGTPAEDLNVWAGETEEVYPNTSGEYVVETIAQLAWIAEQAASPSGFDNKTISFAADLDFHGVEWTPIKQLGRGDYPVHIKGNGHKIMNFTINSGKPAAIISTLVGNIDNLHVENAVVNGAGQVGTLVGKMYGNVTNCSAKNVKVTAKSDANENGYFVEADKVGALVGQIQEGSFKVDNCSVENAEIYGWRELGSILGYSNSSLASFANNSAKNVTILVDEWYHIPYEVGKTQKVGTFVGTHPQYTGTAENVRILKEKADGLVEFEDHFEVSKPAGLAYFGGKQLTKNVELMNDIDMQNASMPSMLPNEGVVFDGNDHTISNVQFVKANDGSAEPGWVAMFSYKAYHGITVKDLILDHVTVANGKYSAAVLAYTEGTNVLENVTVKNSYIAGQNKVGGLVGYLTGNNGATLTATNCHVIESTVTTDVAGGEGQCGGLIGYIQGGAKIQNCSVQKTSIKSHMTEASKTFGKYIGTFHGGSGAWIEVIDGSIDTNTTLTGLDATSQTYVSPYGDFLGGWRTVGGSVRINGEPIYRDHYILNNGVYEIYSAQGLRMAFENPDNTASNGMYRCSAKLMCDIDVRGEWTPIRYPKSYLGGDFVSMTLDGNGKKITNLTVNGDSYLGLFNMYYGTVKDLTIENMTINGTYDLGAIAGSFCGNILNCNVNNLKINGNYYVGGLVGYSQTVKADNCTLTGLDLVATWGYSGGLVGCAGGDATAESYTNNTITGRITVPEYGHALCGASYVNYVNTNNNTDGVEVIIQ